VFFFFFFEKKGILYAIQNTLIGLAI